MSVTRTTTIWCDGTNGTNECGEWRETSGTAKHLRASLAKHGWISYTGGRDMCPECAREVGRR